MSDKLKAKDLSYDSSLAPFLQRLHDQKAGRGDTDRHQRPVARAKRTKDPSEDDGPTIVDDAGETVSKQQFEELTKNYTAGFLDTPNVKGELDPRGAEPKASGALTGASEARKSANQSVTNGNTQMKRKAVKVVGDDEEAGVTKVQDLSLKKAAKKVTRKAKPVQLSFFDDGE